MRWVMVADRMSELTRSEWQSFLPDVNASNEVSLAHSIWSDFRISE